MHPRANKKEHVIESIFIIKHKIILTQKGPQMHEKCDAKVKKPIVTSGRCPSFETFESPDECHPQ